MVVAGKSLVILVQQVLPGRARKGVKDKRLDWGRTGPGTLDPNRILGMG